MTMLHNTLLKLHYTLFLRAVFLLIIWFCSSLFDQKKHVTKVKKLKPFEKIILKYLNMNFRL